jgi:hypothetical protein
MKRFLLPVGIASLVVAGAAIAQTTEDALGVWLNTANKATIEFYKCGDNLCGKLLKVADGQKVDSKNPGGPGFRTTAATARAIRQL